MKTVKNCKKGEIFQECFKQVEQTQGTITVPWKMAPRGRYFKKYCQGRGTRFSSVQVYPGKCSSVDVWANDQSAVRYWRGTTHLGEKKSSYQRYQLQQEPNWGKKKNFWAKYGRSGTCLHSKYILYCYNHWVRTNCKRGSDINIGGKNNQQSWCNLRKSWDYSALAKQIQI